MSGNLSAKHLEAARKVMSSFSFKTIGMKLYTDENGEAPVVVVLPSDPISFVIEGVARMGGAANVVVYRPGYVDIFRLLNKPPTGLVEMRLISASMSVGNFLLQVGNLKPGQSIGFTVEANDSSEDVAVGTQYQYAA